jgi:hypothetical protein
MPETQAFQLHDPGCGDKQVHFWVIRGGLGAPLDQGMAELTRASKILYWSTSASNRTLREMFSLSTC